jgi:hypothetical protein
MLKKMNTSRKILLADAVFIIGIFAYLFFTSSPNAISPVSGQVVSASSSDLVFEIEKGDTVWISTSPDFSDPIILKEGSEIFLTPGEYYWKVKNWLRESEVKSFKVDSKVGLDLYDKGANYELKNSGNVNLDVDQKKGSITSETPLEAGESKVVEKDGSNYEGTQNE